jgi:Protein of unknown function (DUF3309)
MGQPILESGYTCVGVLNVSIGTILLIVLVLILVGIIPAWPHSRSWGYGPSGIVGLIVVVLLILVVLGRI